jgi:hypothetical protein
MAIGQDLLNVPMGDMIRQMAFAIADAQWELDESSIRVAEMMSGRRVLRDPGGKLIDANGAPTASPVTVDTRVHFGTLDENGDRTSELFSMLELGFTPTFYQFVESLIEVKIAIKISYESSYTRTTKGTQTTVSIGDYRSRGWLGGYGYQITTTPVDATYSSKYSYSAEGSSLLRTKLVPVPPPPVLEERIRRLVEQEIAAREEEDA